MIDISYNKVLLNPEKVVPSLSEKEIRIIIVQTLLSYSEKTINLKTLAKVADLIKQYNKSSLSVDLKSDIEEIRTLAFVEDVLADILEELNETH